MPFDHRGRRLFSNRKILNTIEANSVGNICDLKIVYNTILNATPVVDSRSTNFDTRLNVFSNFDSGDLTDVNLYAKLDF